MAYLLIRATRLKKLLVDVFAYYYYIPATNCVNLWSNNKKLMTNNERRLLTGN
jgi:hypothetical protein